MDDASCEALGVGQIEVEAVAGAGAVGADRKDGDIAREANGLMHWWKNEGNAVVVLTIADIVNDKKPDSMMPMM